MFGDLQLNTILERISKYYEIPLDMLHKDCRKDSPQFCMGINKNKKRCLHAPRANGYCGYASHQAQAEEVRKEAARKEADQKRMEARRTGVPPPTPPATEAKVEQTEKVWMPWD